MLSQQLEKEWSLKNTVTADSISKNSHNKALWIGECGHEWEATVKNRTYGAGCPYCYRKFLTGFNDFATVFPEKAKFWNESKNTNPANTFKQSSTFNAWWKCPSNHEWQQPIKDFIKRKTNCLYCEGKKCWTGFNDFTTKNLNL